MSGQQSSPTIESVQQRLEDALMLELSTLPLYLSATFSLVNNNGPWYSFAYDRLWSIARQEMLHLGLVANLINAIGGSPKFDDKKQIPQYPGKGLPGGCLKTLNYSLGPFTPERVRKIFMRIEHPHPRSGKVPCKLSPELDEYIKKQTADYPKDDYTIGDFYDDIIKELTYLDEKYGKALWKGDPSRQLTDPIIGRLLGGKMVKVVDLSTALEAINEVIKEGEGFSLCDPDDGQNELAHFFKFVELHARRAIVKSEGGYTFDQKEVPFSQESDVVNMITLDHKVKYTGDAEAKNNAFNLAFTSLLHGLQQGFTSSPPNVPRMDLVQKDFNITIECELENKQYACPTWEYVHEKKKEEISPREMEIEVLVADILKKAITESVEHIPLSSLDRIFQKVLKSFENPSGK